MMKTPNVKVTTAINLNDLPPGCSNPEEIRAHQVRAESMKMERIQNRIFCLFRIFACVENYFCKMNDCPLEICQNLLEIVNWDVYFTIKGIRAKSDLTTIQRAIRGC